MIDTNIRAVHILTKLALQDFTARGRGYILNVSSSAGFLPGPLMATYYATKNYVLRLTEAIREELRRAGSPVKVCALCPGPVDTEFNKVAGVRFALGGAGREARGARGGGRPVCGQGDRGAGRGNEGHDARPPLCTRLPARARVTYHFQHKKGGA